LYNTALSLRVSAYKQNRGNVSCFTQVKQLPELRESFTEYKDISSQTLQNVIERLGRAYDNFFRRVKKGGEKAGFPRFKGRDRYDSFTLKNTGWKFEDRNLIIRNLGRFKLRLSRPVEGDIKTITILRETDNKWYACFSCDNVPEKRLPKSDKTIGLDVGIKSYLTDSDGNKVENPKFLKESLTKLRIKQRALSRAKKGSNRRRETKSIVSKCYEKVRNQRNDFLHKLANKYVQNNGIIYVENLQINNLVRNHSLARDINDCSWGKFFELLSYKAAEAGRELIKVNPRNTSKKCSNCGAINQELKLSGRMWVCKVCGAIHDRDHNGAKNIHADGQSVRELTYASR
jgi:putative transposase